MINVKILPLRNKKTSSTMRNPAKKFIAELFENPDFNYQVVDNTIDLYKGEVAILLVEGDNVQGVFWNYLPKLSTPILVMPVTGNESLAAAMEIVAFLNSLHLDCHPLLGDYDTIRNRIRFFVQAEPTNTVIGKIGVVISEENVRLSSYNVDLRLLLGNFGLEEVGISEEEFIKTYNDLPKLTMPKDFFNVDWDYYELDKNYRVYLTFKKLIAKYKLIGICKECYSLSVAVRATACLAYDKLCQEGYYVACHNDVPALLGSYIVKNLFKQDVFQGTQVGNDYVQNLHYYSHSFVPSTMIDKRKAQTEATFNIGVSSYGDLQEGPVTFFTISMNLKYFFVSEGTVTRNAPEKVGGRMACIEVKSDTDLSLWVDYIGDPVLFFYGHHKAELTTYLNNRGLVSYEDKIQASPHTFFYMNEEAFKQLVNVTESVDFYEQSNPYVQYGIGTIVTVFAKGTNESFAYRATDKKVYENMDLLIKDIDAGKLNYSSFTPASLKKRLASNSFINQKNTLPIIAIHIVRV
ncbi:MAG: hypothetical protein WCR56_01715 [Bacilli bacterium]